MVYHRYDFMDVAGDDEGDNEAGWYQSDDEDEENGDSEEDDDDVSGPEDGELDVAMACDYDFL
ncbi:hypothetical protein HWV62_32067 [Athelia sp. TMB]|nr:hypothetical protein HWV62_32067 [Athelia sp. TMB]